MRRCVLNRPKTMLRLRGAAAAPDSTAEAA